MKRLLIIVLLLANIYPSLNKSSIVLKPVTAVYAQSTPCTDPSSCGSSGNGDNHSWLWYIFHWVANAVSTLGEAIGDIFSGGGSGGEIYGTGILPYVNSNPYISYIYTGYNNGGWGSGGPMDPCQFNQMMGLPCLDTTMADPSVGNFDCAGVLGGTAHLDSCGRCVGGTTGLQECEKDCAGVWGGTAVKDSCHVCAGGTTGIQRCDTVQPIPVPCDSAAIARGQRLTSVMNSANGSSPLIQQVKDSGYVSRNEASVSIVNDVTYHIDAVNFQIGVPGSVQLPTTLPGHNVIAGLHAHTEGHAISPSPSDIYHLANGNLLYNHNYFADYVTSYDSTQWAISISDTASAHTFITTFPDSIYISGADWDSVRINPGLGTTIREKFLELYKTLWYVKHYPQDYCYAYANMLFLEFTFGTTGFKYYIKKNGSYKELSIQKIYDANGNPVDINITICQ